MKMNVKTSMLELQPFLKGMATSQLDLLAADSLPVEFKAGEWIMNEGGPANRFYLIVEGQVVLESPESDGQPIHVDTLGAGDVLGWSWLFPPYYWHFDARAVTPTRAIFFYGTRLRELCEENHDLGYELMRRVAQVIIKRLQATRHELAEQKRLLDAA